MRLSSKLSQSHAVSLSRKYVLSNSSSRGEDSVDDLFDTTAACSKAAFSSVLQKQRPDTEKGLKPVMEDKILIMTLMENGTLLVLYPGTCSCALFAMIFVQSILL